MLGPDLSLLQRPSCATPLHPACCTILLRTQVLLKHKYPHRLVLEADTHDESIEYDAREAADAIMAAYESRSSGKRVLPQHIRAAFQKIKSGTADCCAVGAADHDCSFWDIPEDFFSAFEKDATALVCLLHLLVIPPPRPGRTHPRQQCASVSNSSAVAVVNMCLWESIR